MKNICEKQELVAYRVKKNPETEEVCNIKMIFLCVVERLNNKGDIILESDKYVYSISDINEKLFNKLGLSIDILKDYFSIIK